MPPLDHSLRSVLEKAVLEARGEAEEAAEVALKVLGVDRPEAFATQTDDQRRLRKALRAKARHLGGGRQVEGFRLLKEEVAYEQWHRMLFARFLAENDLLMHPSGVPVTLEDCEELAVEEGDADRWMTAARYASRMLPGIFRPDDPSVRVLFAPEGRSALEGILAGLPKAVFTSDDGLGWVYQFWQSKKKKEVSGSGNKIEKLDLAAYSQLFTEDYMVRFLLENSLGAWWAARHPDSPLVRQFEYLRFRDDGTPAAGTFPGWPERAAEMTVMDPCCGSGHFLVSAFEMLRRMRMEEEGLAEAEAAEAVLRDNLFGLEIDPRCVQIAAFALALVAWKSGGYRPLPLPNIACSGIPVADQLENWTRLAGDDVNLQHSLERLYHLFSNAPDLGSLINPADVPVRDRMFEPDLAKVSDALGRALSREQATDPVAAIFGGAVLGIVRAAELLADHYTLVATNVPYLTRNKHGETLKEFLESSHPTAKADIATAFIERCRAFAKSGGSYAVVAPQNWLFLGTYRSMRQLFLQQQQWRIVIKMGERGFQSNAAAGAFTALLIVNNTPPEPGDVLRGLDASEQLEPRKKAALLVEGQLDATSQASQLSSPDARITFEDFSSVSLLDGIAASYQGIKTGDDERYRRQFWEVKLPSSRWSFYQSTVSETKPFGGLEYVVDWSTQGREFARLQGLGAWNKPGIAVSLMRELRSALFMGQPFDSNIAAVTPKNPAHLGALWAFCSSPEFSAAVRRIDAKLNVTNATVVKVPFDLERWQKIAEETGSLPEPYSNDPTQWLFKGDPAECTEPLQVAVARLLGYHWPQQEPDRLSRMAETDGVLPLVPVGGKEPTAERLRAVLAAAFGEGWSGELQERLLREAGFGGKGLDVWLRDGFFEQHCKLFHQRPFIWHIWDGRRDGFSALANYHRLDAANLNRLIYTYLGDWIRTQRAANEANVPGAEARLVAALALQEKLELIRDGEPPYDIYVRWKPLHQQPIGWDPDLNDGVRLNIRPFVEAGVLRSRVNVNWKKDRGLNPDGSERINDRHYTIAEKRAAREAAKK